MDHQMIPSGRTFRRQGPPPPASPDALRELQDRLTRPRSADPAAPSRAVHHRNHPAPDAPRAEWASYFHRLGFRLCAIPAGRKGPVTPGWPEGNLPPEYWLSHPQEGLGVVLGPSRLVSLDLDSLPEARAVLDALGLALDDLLSGAMLVRGNPERLRAIFRAPSDLDLTRKSLAWPAREEGGRPVTVFELRGGPVQDVLPPTIHPDTGRPYEWITPPWELDRLGTLPDALLELWIGWDAWHPGLVQACPWAPPAPEPEARPSTPPTGGQSVVDEWNRCHDAGELLAAHGYREKGPGRWIAPQSTSGLAGVVRLQSGKVFSHHGADPLADGFAHDAFDLFRLLEHEGDHRQAIKAAARLLGMERERPPALDMAAALAGLAPPTEGEAPPGRKAGWRLVPARELLMDPEPLRWLVHGYLQPESLDLLFGDPEAGKSLVAIDWAACLATGQPWNGHAHKPVSVIYLAGEGFSGIKRRLYAWAVARGCVEELRAAPLVVSSAGAALTEPSQVSMVSAAIDEIAAEHGQPGLIVIDTLARNFGAADENSASDINAFVSAADFLRTRYQAAVLVVHHSGHATKSRSRGSSAIRGAVDAEFCLANDAGGIRTLTATKTKDAPPPAPMTFALRVVELPWRTEDGETETSVILTPDPRVMDAHRRRKAPPSVSLAYESLLACLDEAGEEAPDTWRPPAKAGPRPDLVAPLDAWREEFIARHVGDSDETKGRAFRRAREQLTTAGAVAVWRDLYWPRPDVAPWPDLAAMLTAATLCRAANRAAAGHSPDIRRTFSSCPDTDKERTLPGQNAGCPDMSGHTPKGVSECPPCPAVRPVRQNEKDTETDSLAGNLDEVEL